MRQALEAAKSLEEVTAAHQDFMSAARRQCLLAPDRTWKLIEGVVVQILNQVLYFAELQQKLQRPVSCMMRTCGSDAGMHFLCHKQSVATSTVWWCAMLQN